MAIKKVPTGYEVRFRVNGCGSSSYPKTFSKKGECERLMRYSIAKFEIQADVKPWLDKSEGHIPTI